MCIRDRVSCVNALSDYVRVEVQREGKKFEQEYSKGIPLGPVKEIGVSDKTGTRVTFRPDAEIFESLEYTYATLASRIRELAYLNKGLYLTLTDEREVLENGEFKKNDFHSEGGLKEFVQYLDETRTPLITCLLYTSRCV